MFRDNDAARVVDNTGKPTLQGFVGDHADEGATVCTDESAVYRGLPFDHEAANL